MGAGAVTAAAVPVYALGVTVVVCAHTERRISALITAVVGARDQLGPDDELIVVIDHNDVLLEMARQRLLVACDGARPAVRVIANDFPRGLSGARNAGLAHSRGGLVVFLDDDAEPRAGWLARLIEGFANPGVVAVAGLVSPAWEGQAPRWMPSEFLWVVGCSYRGLPDPPAEVRNPIGANMAFRRGPVEVAGGFKDGIGRVGRTALGCEETELSIRLRGVAGGRIIQVPGAVVDHLVPRERARLGYFVKRCWAEGISKAVVAHHVGASAALASERRYAMRILPSGVVRGLQDSVQGDLYGLARALAILLGLMITGAGYLHGVRSMRGIERPP